MKSPAKILLAAGMMSMLLLTNCGPRDRDNDDTTQNDGTEYDNTSDATDGTGSSMGTDYDDEMNDGTGTGNNSGTGSGTTGTDTSGTRSY